MQDNWEPARQAFAEAVRIDPGYIPALDGLGFTLEALGDDPGAVASYEQAVALNRAQQGRNAAPSVNLSAFYNRTREPAKALDYARQALELDPRSDRAWFQRAKAEDSLERPAEAALALKQAISLNPRASSYHYVLARLYQRLGREEESRAALADFKRLQLEAGELEKRRREVSRGSSSPAGPEG